MRFVMNLDLSSAERTAVLPIETLCGRHIGVVNDIFSYEKEVGASKEAKTAAADEGSSVCNAVAVVAQQFDLGVGDAKEVLWAMCRGWERAYDGLVEERGGGGDGGWSEALGLYVQGLGFQMRGNEAWSRRTDRYRGKSGGGGDGSGDGKDRQEEQRGGQSTIWGWLGRFLWV